MGKTNYDMEAVIKATGKRITVYRHREGGYVDSNDMTTRYEAEKLKFGATK